MSRCRHQESRGLSVLLVGSFATYSASRDDVRLRPERGRAGLDSGVRHSSTISLSSALRSPLLSRRKRTSILDSEYEDLRFSRMSLAEARQSFTDWLLGTWRKSKKSEAVPAHLRAFHNDALNRLLRIQDSCQRIGEPGAIEAGIEAIADFIVERCPLSSSQTLRGTSSELFRMSFIAPDWVGKVDVATTIFNRVAVLLDDDLENHPDIAPHVIRVVRRVVEDQPDDAHDVNHRLVGALCALNQDQREALGPVFWKRFVLVMLSAAELQIYNLSSDASTSRLASEFVNQNLDLFTFFMVKRRLRHPEKNCTNPLIQDEEWRQALLDIPENFANDFVRMVMRVAPRMLKEFRPPGRERQPSDGEAEVALIKSDGEYPALKACLRMCDVEVVDALAEVLVSINSIVADFAPDPATRPFPDRHIYRDDSLLFMACMYNISGLEEDIIWEAGSDAVFDLLRYAADVCKVKYKIEDTRAKPPATPRRTLGRRTNVVRRRTTTVARDDLLKARQFVDDFNQSRNASPTSTDGEISPSRPMQAGQVLPTGSRSQVRPSPKFERRGAMRFERRSVSPTTRKSGSRLASPLLTKRTGPPPTNFRQSGAVWDDDLTPKVTRRGLPGGVLAGMPNEPDPNSTPVVMRKNSSRGTLWNRLSRQFSSDSKNGNEVKRSSSLRH